MNKDRHPPSAIAALIAIGDLDMGWPVLCVERRLRLR